MEATVDMEPVPGLVKEQISDGEEDEAPGVENCDDDIAFQAMSLNRMCDPMMPMQMALIHQTEHMGACTANEQTLMEAVRADDNWQKQLQSNSESASDAESDEELIETNEPVSLFGLFRMEPCLVAAKKYTLWLHMCTYVQCTMVCPGATENDLYLCERCLILSG